MQFLIIPLYVLQLTLRKFNLTILTHHVRVYVYSSISFQVLKLMNFSRFYTQQVGFRKLQRSSEIYPDMPCQHMFMLLNLNDTWRACLGVENCNAGSLKSLLFYALFMNRATRVRHVLHPQIININLRHMLIRVMYLFVKNHSFLQVYLPAKMTVNLCYYFTLNRC